MKAKKDIAVFGAWNDNAKKVQSVRTVADVISKKQLCNKTAGTMCSGCVSD